jgi:hypothetical protein
VTVLAINLQAEPDSLNLSAPGEQYELTGLELQSREVLLNGRPLGLEEDDSLPAIRPNLSKGQSVALAPLSINFITLPTAANPACTT